LADLQHRRAIGIVWDIGGKFGNVGHEAGCKIVHTVEIQMAVTEFILTKRYTLLIFVGCLKSARDTTETEYI